MACIVAGGLPDLRPCGAERYRVSLRILVVLCGGKKLEKTGIETLRGIEKARRIEGVLSGTICGAPAGAGD